MEHQHTHAEHVAFPRSSIRKFLPLIIIFSVILLFTAWRYAVRDDADLISAMRDFMGAFFIVFGGFKVMNWNGFVTAYQMYDIIAMKSKVYAYVYPVIELGLGVAYFVVTELFLVHIVTIVIMTIGALGVARKLMQHEVVPCACLGAVFAIPMTKVTLMEDVLMIGMASIMIVV